MHGRCLKCIPVEFNRNTIYTDDEHSCSKTAYKIIIQEFSETWEGLLNGNCYIFCVLGKWTANQSCK